MVLRAAETVRRSVFRLLGFGRRRGSLSERRYRAAIHSRLPRRGVQFSGGAITFNGRGRERQQARRHQMVANQPPLNGILWVGHGVWLYDQIRRRERSLERDPF